MRRLALLIDELLDVSRVEARALEPRKRTMDLATLAREVGARYRSGSSAMIVHADGPVVGNWDPSQLERVLENLLSNAAKFGEDEPVDISLEREGSVARLVVADHGIGIAEEQLPFVFDRYHRGVSSKHYGGLGLGLYIVKAIVTAYGGTVRVESTVGRGTRFHRAPDWSARAGKEDRVHAPATPPPPVGEALNTSWILDLAPGPTFARRLHAPPIRCVRNGTQTSARRRRSPGRGRRG